MNSDTITRILLAGVFLALVANGVALLARPQAAFAQAPQPLTAVVTRWENRENVGGGIQEQQALECTVFFANGATGRFERSYNQASWRLTQ
jgi:hypothetical protein